MTKPRDPVGISNVSFHHPRYGGRVHRINWDKLGWTKCGAKFAWIPQGSARPSPGSLMTLGGWSITLAEVSCRACKKLMKEEG